MYVIGSPSETLPLFIRTDASPQIFLVLVIQQSWMVTMLYHVRSNTFCEIFWIYFDIMKRRNLKAAITSEMQCLVYQVPSIIIRLYSINYRQLVIMLLNVLQYIQEFNTQK